jgi:hypothetical protein
MKRIFSLTVLLLLQLLCVDSFVGESLKVFKSTAIDVQRIPQYERQLVVVNDQRWNRDIEENSRRKAKSSGMGETLAGAVLGSLVLGPFGKWLNFRS